MSGRDGKSERQAALYALVQRLGGHVVIPAEELMTTPFSIVRTWTKDGGLNIKIVVDDKPM